jgi:hypothetical protein
VAPVTDKGKRKMIERHAPIDTRPLHGTQRPVSELGGSERERERDFGPRGDGDEGQRNVVFCAVGVLGTWQAATGDV